MKIEIGDKKPDNFKERWPGEFTIMSHFEMALGIPHLLFLVTTLKENGQPNVCFNSWSSFSGDSGGYYVIMPICKHTHTYSNILRNKEFCINFLSVNYYADCYKTVFDNTYDDDEISVGGFTPEPSKNIKTPRIKEAFLSLECTFESETDLSQKGISTIIIGKVSLASIEEKYINGDEQKYGKNGFMFYLNNLKNFEVGNDGEREVACLSILQKG